MTQHPRGEMDEIPEDVWQLAVDALPGTARADLKATRTVIARAIMAERERSAKAADHFTNARNVRRARELTTHEVYEIARLIDAAIRKGPTL